MNPLIRNIIYGRAAAILDLSSFALVSAIKAEPAKHIVLVNFSTFHPKLEKLPRRAFYIIQHCLGVNVVATHHEPCKWLIKNGPSMILAERESGVLFLWQKEKVVCCSRVKKGKTSILWHKTMRIQDILTNLGIYLVTILFHLLKTEMGHAASTCALSHINCLNSQTIYCK